MDNTRDNRNGILKRCGIVALSALMVLAGVFAVGNDVDPVRIIMKDDGYVYAVDEVAGETQKSIESSFPELTGSSGVEKLTKDETVYVIMDADGNKEETVVSAWLRNPEELDTIKDKSNLEDITNTSGDEKFTKNGKRITWAAEGSDIKYTGNTDRDLPVGVEVTYYLNGEPVSASEIKGQKGEVEIHFDYYINKHERVEVDGNGYDIEHPYIMASGLMLDNEHFRNVEVTNGKCISEGGNSICVGIALPSLRETLALEDDMLDIPESVVVKAVTDEFSIDGTYTIALTGLLGDLDFSAGDITGRLGDIESALSKLSAASKKLVKGSNALKKGTSKLASGASDLSDGTSQLADGASSLEKGAGKLAEGTAKLRKRSKKLQSGVKKLYKGSRSLSKGTSEVRKGTEKAAEGAEKLADGLSKLSGNSEALNEATATLESNIFDNATTQVREKLIEAGIPKAIADTFTLTKSNYPDVIGALKKLAPSKTAELDDLKTTLDNLEEYVSGVKEYTDGVDTASEGMDEFNRKIKDLDKGTKKVKNGASKLKKGLSELSGSIPKLRKGIKSLDSGASQVESGASKIRKGASKADSGASTLDNGASKLNKGAEKLADGMNRFDRDGISKFVNSLDEFDIDGLFGRIQALSKASGRHYFVGGAPSGIAGESKIIFKTKEI